MSRPILAEAQIHPAIRDKVATRNSDIVREVQQALTENDVVVVGMRQNRLIVSGELSRLLTKQSNNASQVCSVSTTLTGTRYAPQKVRGPAIT